MGSPKRAERAVHKAAECAKMQSNIPGVGPHSANKDKKPTRPQSLLAASLGEANGFLDPTHLLLEQPLQQALLRSNFVAHSLHLMVQGPNASLYTGFLSKYNLNTILY